MKNIFRSLAIIAIAVVFGFSFAACGDGGDSGDDGNGTPVTFLSVSANGSVSQTTTELTLTFSDAIDGLSASNITLRGISGISKGTLSGNNPYVLPVSGLSEDGTLTVSVSKSGYTISGSPKTTEVFRQEGQPSHGVSGDFEYLEYSKRITIYKYKGNASSVTIPNQIAGKSVTSIGFNAFMDCKSLTSVTIPNSVTSIDYGAFVGCSSLGSVIIPNNVTSIGENAFATCTSLASVTFGNSLTSIGKNSFLLCSIGTITLPNSVNSIEEGAFYCTNLSSVTFQGTILSSGFSTNNAFIGDLRAKFYATNASNGTPGTYTTTAPVGYNSVWTKQ